MSETERGSKDQAKTKPKKRVPRRRPVVSRSDDKATGGGDLPIATENVLAAPKHALKRFGHGVLETHVVDRQTVDRVVTAARESEKFRDVVPALTPKQAMFLCAVKELGDDAYGVRIAQWMTSELRGRAVNPGQIYGIADEMVRDHLVSEDQRPSPHGRGRPIIVYKLTPVGESAIAALGLVLAAGYRRPTTPGRWARSKGKGM